MNRTPVDSKITWTALVAAALALLCGISPAAAQSLQLKAPLDRSMSPKSPAHEYAVVTQANQSFTVTVEQQGIDVVVTVLGPDGKQLLSVDSASEADGTEGSEIARVAALTAGEYRVRVAPFERADAKPAKYVVSLSEVRDLTLPERTNAQSERDIADLEEQWERARDKLDIATLSRILREDGFALGTTAEMRTREQIIAGWEAEAARRTKLGTSREHTVSEHALKAAGNVAVSTGRFLLTNTGKDGVASRGSGQFVHIWAKNEGGWKLVGDYTFPFGRVPRQEGDAITVDRGVLSAYAGTYRREFSSGTITVTLEDGVLQVQRSDIGSTSQKMPLRPLRETTFSAPGLQEFTFVRSASGEVGELILMSDGPASRAFRVK